MTTSDKDRNGGTAQVVFPMTFERRRGVLFEPAWAASRIREVRSGDTGGARALILDVFVPLERAVSFETRRRGDHDVAVLATAPDGDAFWRPAGEGPLRTDSGAIAVADETELAEALALERDADRIEHELGFALELDPGRYEARAWTAPRDMRVALAFRRLEDVPADDLEEPFPDEAIDLAAQDELDLHGFEPREARAVLDEYCREAARRGLRQVRIIHGKGKGEIRRMTHAALLKHPSVALYYDAPVTRGGLGATIVELKEPE